MYSEPRNTKKKKRKNDRDSIPSNSYTTELTSSGHVNQKASLNMPTPKDVYPEVEQIEEKHTASRFAEIVYMLSNLFGCTLITSLLNMVPSLCGTLQCEG